MPLKLNIFNKKAQNENGQQTVTRTYLDTGWAAPITIAAMCLEPASAVYFLFMGGIAGYFMDELPKVEQEEEVLALPKPDNHQPK